MLLVNVGTQGFTKIRNGEKGAVLETKHFPPNIPVECSDEMGKDLLKKYNNPTMQIIMRSAEGFALSDNVVVPVVTEQDGQTSFEIEQPGIFQKKRGRPRKK
jgi:hypothetical protein